MIKLIIDCSMPKQESIYSKKLSRDIAITFFVIQSTVIIAPRQK